MKSGSDNEYAEWIGGSGNKAILDDPHERLMSKLGKLLEVKNRAATEAEAAAAMGLLSRFMTEHNLSMADLEKRGGAIPSVKEEGHDLGKAAFKWKLELAEGIAEFYYCHGLVDRTRKTVTFVGRPDNVQALQMLYAWIIEQVKGIAREARRAHFDETGEHIDPLRWQVSFGEGAVDRLVERLRELKARQAENMSRDEYGNVTAIALHHASEASDYLEAKYGYRADGKRTRAEQEREERYQRQAEEKDELEMLCKTNGNMEPYWVKYPWERPLTPEQQARRDKEHEEYMKRERNNARRRTGGGGWGRKRRVDEVKEGQQERASAAGRKGADKVNLQPFIAGSTAKGQVK